MKIIAQQSNSLNTYDFRNNVIQKNYIDGMTLNVALTQDNKILIYNISANNDAIVNTIETSTLFELNNYELELLDDALKDLSKRKMSKNIYINLAPFRIGVLSDENIKEMSERMNLYIDKINEIITKYPNLKIHLHSINKSLITIMKQKIKNNPIGAVVYNRDADFIDVDYYVIMMSAFDDAIIDLLLREEKQVLLFIYSDYYISYVYEHYIGENSTPYLAQVFNKIKIITKFPEIINKVFN